ncbi:MAG: hypothetical protein ACOYUZ_05350 [Patescibacteria group bacterium]
MKNERTLKYDFELVKSCADFCEDHFVEAAQSREATYAFLDHIARICEPHDGEENIIFFLARLASTGYKQIALTRTGRLTSPEQWFWLDSDLRVEITRLSLTECSFRLLMSLGGGDYELLKRIEILRSSFGRFKELMSMRREIEPFVPVMAVGEKLLLETKAVLRKSTVPPPSMADARERMLERAAWILRPAAALPTFPPPDEGDDPNAELEHALVCGGVPKAPLPPGRLMSDPPSGLGHAIVCGHREPKPRPMFDSFADEARYLAEQEPDIPAEPRSADSRPTSGMSGVIGRISLAQVPARQAGQPASRPAPHGHLRNRPETERPPGIEKADGGPSIPPLPLVTADKRPTTDEEPPSSIEIPVDVDDVDEGW